MSPDPIPYTRQVLGEEEIQAVIEVLRSGWIARGPRARTFEEACEARLEARHAVACASGSAALEIALRALGVGPGDEVVVPTLTWVATAAAVRLVGATPVLCDVDPDTLCATPGTVAIACSDRTRAVIAVDFAGVPADTDGLRRLCDARGAFLIEDAAHAFGARLEDGTPVGRDGAAHATAFSFHPAKTITTAEGGLVTCADDALAARLRAIRSGGVVRGFEGARGAYDYRAEELGGNHHLSELGAALGLAQIDRLDDLLARRADAFDALGRALAPLSGELELPFHPAGSSHNLYVVQLTGGVPRDRVLALLRERGVLASMHYPLLHTQPLFRADGDAFPHAERYARRALTLPLFPDLTADQVSRVAATLAAVLDDVSATSPPRLDGLEPLSLR